MDGPKPEKPVDQADTVTEVAKPAHRSFMDIRRPKAEVSSPADAVAEKSEDAPKSDVKADEPMAEAPAQTESELADDPAQKLDESKKAKQPKEPKPPKQPHTPGVGLAIFATVVIILGLAALATYAYLQTNNAAPF